MPNATCRMYSILPHMPAASVALILGPILLDIYITYLAFSFLIKFKQQRQVGLSRAKTLAHLVPHYGSGCRIAVPNAVLSAPEITPDPPSQKATNQVCLHMLPCTTSPRVTSAC